jgi:hypothetical protein
MACVHVGMGQVKRVCFWMLAVLVSVSAGCTAGAHPAPKVKDLAQAPKQPAAVASRWKLVRYHKVQVRVPVGWPVVDGMHTPLCGGPFLSRPTVFVGPNQNGPAFCPAIARTTQGREGVWLQPGNPPASARPVRVAPGTVVLRGPPTVGGVIEMLWFHAVEIDIGIGPDRLVARAILESIRYTPRLPDSRAAGTCARAAHPGVMPRPERLARRLVLKQIGVTLAPPLRSDQPVMSAALAWTDDIWRGLAFERYRLILARYSASNPPAPNPARSARPVGLGALAWIAYSSPRSPMIPGCGNWAVDVFNAMTGQGLLTVSWSPGLRDQRTRL